MFIETIRLQFAQNEHKYVKKILKNNVKIVEIWTVVFLEVQEAEKGWGGCVNQVIKTKVNKNRQVCKKFWLNDILVILFKIEK